LSLPERFHDGGSPVAADRPAARVAADINAVVAGSARSRAARIARRCIVPPDASFRTAGIECGALRDSLLPSAAMAGYAGFFLVESLCGLLFPWRLPGAVNL
jgi:hypothetical protein